MKGKAVFREKTAPAGYFLELEKLHKLRKKRKFTQQGERDFLDYRGEMLKKYGMDPTTLYNHLNKHHPMPRKPRADKGTIKGKTQTEKDERVKLQEKQYKIFNELRESGYTQTEAAAKTAMKTGELCSLGAMRSRENKLKLTTTISSNFGENAKEYFKELFEYRFIGPEAGIEMKYNGKRFWVTKPDIDDLCLILSNAYNRSEIAKEKKLPCDRTVIRKLLMTHLLDDVVFESRTKLDAALLQKLTASFDKLYKDPDAFGINFKVMCCVVREFAPDVSSEEILARAKKYKYLSYDRG